MTHREEKSAKLKLLILQRTLELSQQKTFKDIHVQEICKVCRISKVTFFKYFPQKEDVLLYYFRIWGIRCSVELAKNKKEGLDGLYYLFEQIGKEYEKHKHIVLALVGYLVNMDKPHAPFPVKKAEKEILFTDANDVELNVTGLHQMMEKFLLEAIFKKQITKVSSTSELTNVFLTLFYGNILTAHLRQQPVRRVLHHNFNDLLRGLQ